MGSDFRVTMNEYLPLRDVVFNTLRQAILKGELEPKMTDGDSACSRDWASAGHRFGKYPQA